MDRKYHEYNLDKKQECECVSEDESQHDGKRRILSRLLGVLIVYGENGCVNTLARKTNMHGGMCV